MEDRTTSEAGQNRSIITILLVAAFVVILNETTMNVALPTIMESVGVSERTASWLTTGFMLTMAVVIPITGWLLERLTTRTAFIAAMTLFSIGTLLCAIAPSFAFLLVGRIVQATGTAIMMPLLMTTVMRLVEPERRGAVMGNISLVISVAPATGPTLAGLLLQAGSWNLIFLVMLPIALTMLAAGAKWLRNTGELHKSPLDAWSVVLTVLGFGPLVYGLSQIGAEAVAIWVAPAMIAFGLAGLALFVRRQISLQRRDAALLDLRTFTFPTFVVPLSMLALGMAALFGSIIMLPMLLEKAYGLEPIQIGLMLLPGGIAMGLLGPVAGRLYDRLGPRALVTPAAFVVLGVFAFLANLSASTPWWAVVAAHMVMSVCFAFIFTPLFTVALGSLPPYLYSHGSATVGTTQQVAGAAGTAVFVTIFALGRVQAEHAGASEGAAVLAGSHGSFWAAAAVWLLAIATSFRLRVPEPIAEPSDLAAEPTNKELAELH